MKTTLRAVAFLLSVALATPLHAQILVPMTPGQYLRGQALASMGQFALTVGEWARRNRELEVEIVTARRLFWESRAGAEREAAAKRFEDALMKRDLHYIVSRVLDSPGGKAPLMALATDLSGQNRVDGGISPYCYQSYKKWAEGVIDHISAKMPLDKAVQQMEPQYAAYRVERDTVEYLFYNPNSPLRASTTPAQEYLAAWILG